VARSAWSSAPAGSREGAQGSPLDPPFREPSPRRGGNPHWRPKEKPAIVSEEFPFSVWIEPDPLNARRFRWSIREGERIALRSERSYGDRREAEDQAALAMMRMELRRAGLGRP
jgi:hypothetical protein